MNRPSVAGFAALAAALPAAAEANSGIGLFVHATPAMVIALPLAIFIEAPVLARGFGVSFKRSLALSASANVVSTLLGVFIAFALDLAILAPLGSSGLPGGRGPMLVSLLPMFFVTWWIEARVVRAQVKDAALRVGRFTFAANALTYALMAVGVWAWAPPWEGSVRERMLGAFNDIGVAKVEVAEQFQKEGHFGPARQLSARSPLLRSLRIESNGRIVAVVVAPRLPDLDGKSIFVQPRIEGGRIVEWQCTSDGPGKYLPAYCR